MREQPVQYTAEQMLLLTASGRQAVEKLYTDRIWDVRTGAAGRRYEDAFYEGMKQFFVELAVMNGIAAERGVKLDAGEKKALSDAAREFYASSVEGREPLGNLSEEDTEEMFRQYALALKLKNQMLQDRKTEVSESEAKVIRIQQIRTPDENTAQLIFDRASEGADFYALAKAYETERSTSLKTGRGSLPEELEKAAFSLEDGEVSSPVLYDGQYYIFKSLDSYDEAETAVRRKGLQAERLRDVLADACRDYRRRYRVSLDSQRWEQAAAQAGFPYEGESFFTAVKEAMGE